MHLKLMVGGTENWDEDNEEFVYLGGFPIHLEHSLYTVSKWEAIHQKPFLTKDEKSAEEMLDYVLCMVQEDIAPEVLSTMTQAHVAQINEYINSPQTATTFKNTPPGRQQEILTSELLYYWLTKFEIPWEAQHWPLNRLFTLLKVFNVKEAPPKKQDSANDAVERARLNAERLKQFETTG